MKLYGYTHKSVISVFISIILLITISPVINPSSSFFDLEWSEEVFWEGLNECTTGVCSGAATPDGKPLLWKNRDVGSRDMEFHYYDDGRIPFISIATIHAPDAKYFGGVNAAGFGIENSNYYNLPYGGSGDPDDDGWIHREALARLRTVDEFESFIDSLNLSRGVNLNSNYGDIDAFGGAAMFEVSAYSYTRFDCDDQPDGIIIRANYSYSGSRLNNRRSGDGPYRHDRSLTKWKEAVENDNLTPKFHFQNVVRDISIQGVDPYPLPFDGYYENSPYGHIPNSEAVCRRTTRGVLVVQGVQANQSPDGTILWAMGGNQIGTIALPLWVRAGSVPVEFDSPDGSSICDVGQVISGWVNIQGSVDTWKLTNPDGSGIWDYTFPLENWVFDKVDRFVSSPDFDFDLVEAFQNEIAQQVVEKLENFSPSHQVTEISEPVFMENNIEFVWASVTSDGLGRDNSPRGYNIFRSDKPFRESNRGELVGFVTSERFTDYDPLTGGAFYRVEAIF